MLSFDEDARTVRFEATKQHQAGLYEACIRDTLVSWPNAPEHIECFQMLVFPEILPEELSIPEEEPMEQLIFLPDEVLNSLVDGLKLEWTL